MQQQKAPAMRTCPHCKMRVQVPDAAQTDEQARCPLCQLPFVAPPKPQVCAACGMPLAAGQRSCPVCGGHPVARPAPQGSHPTTTDNSTPPAATPKAAKKEAEKQAAKAALAVGALELVIELATELLGDA